MKYEDLVIACTVGTGTRPISRDLLPDPIAAALPAQDGDDDLALDAAAVWGLLRASRLPKVTPGEPVALPAETRPRLPASTASLLTRIAVDNAAHEFEALLGGLQELADRHGNTIALPDELLVALLERLDQARLARVLRTLLGPRDHAFINLRSHWRNAYDKQFDPKSPIELDDEIWQIGSSVERVSYLRELRRRDPERVRQVLADPSFRKEKPADRADFIKALENGLGPDDVELLEQLLDDRSSKAREEAAKLARLIPGSPLVARAEELARSHVQVVRDVDGLPSLELIPIDETPETRRDAYFADYKGHAHGVKRVLELFEYVRPGRWLELIGLNYYELVRAAERHPEVNRLLPALAGAAANFRDSQAAEVLLGIDAVLEFDPKVPRDGNLPEKLMPKLDAQQVDRWLHANLATLSPKIAERTLGAIRVPIHPLAAEQLLVNIEGWLGGARGQVELAISRAAWLIGQQQYDPATSARLAGLVRALLARHQDGLLANHKMLNRAASQLELAATVRDAVARTPAAAPATPSEEPR